MSEAIDKLGDQARVVGASRVLRDGVAADAVTAEQRAAVIAAVNDYAFDTGISRSAIAKSLGVSPATLGLFLKGNYKGNVGQLSIDLDNWLESQLRRDAAPQPSTFVWTKVAQEIRTVGNVAATLGTIGLVYGPETSGTGKTLALRAIAAEQPGAILVTAEKLTSTAGTLITSIARALRIGTSSAWNHLAFQRVKEQLAGTSRLLMVDQVHNLCTGRDDRALFMLADLHDATGAPQLWCGTTDVVAYLNRGQARGRETLAQIRRRIGVARDLMERTRGGPDGDGPGEPLYTLDEVRRVFARNKMRLTPDAARYLMALANLPDSGALGACANLVMMATTLYAAEAPAITADMLRASHRLLVSRGTFVAVEQRLTENNSAPLHARAG